MPAPTIETLPISRSVSTRLTPSCGLHRGQRRLGGAQVLGADRERDLGVARPRSSGSFWMIVSTLQLASASAMKIEAAAPGRSGTPTSVIRASSRGVGDGGDQRVFHGLVFSEDKGTGAGIEAGPAVDLDAVGPGVLDRAQLEHLGAGRRHLQHLLEAHLGQLAGVGNEPWVGAEHAGDVGVDLAHLGARWRRRRRPRSCPSRRGPAWSRRGWWRPPESRPRARSVVVERLA